MAEGIFRKMLDEKGINYIEVKSCGINADEGTPVSVNAVIAAKEYGADISAHTAVPFTPEIVSYSTIFVCMTYSHLLSLLGTIPREQLFVLGNGIPDPYMGDEETYRRCAKAIYNALPELMNTLKIE